MKNSVAQPRPTIVPLGDSALLVRFAEQLGEDANRAAIKLAHALDDAPIPGVLEVAPGLVSVLLRYDPFSVSFEALAGEVRLMLGSVETAPEQQKQEWQLRIRFDGPDLAEVASALELSPAEFVAAHNSRPLRVLATGFAPGFVYCGLHPDRLTLPRRNTVRPRVEAGSVLFAAGQTAIAATAMPTGWHVIGHTDFSNFDSEGEPPTRLRAGDVLRFEAWT